MAHMTSTFDSIPPQHAGYVVTGTDPDQLQSLRNTGIDHHALPVTAFVDQDGEWPLRCCLADSRPGDRLAIVGWSPFPWNGAYRMSGPIVIHADFCPQPMQSTSLASVPQEFESRRQILRAYDDQHLQIYELGTLVEPSDGLQARLIALFQDPRTQLVQSFNVLSGCWSFTAHRGE